MDYASFCLTLLLGLATLLQGLEGATVSFAMKTFNVKQGGNVSWSVNVGNYATAADIQIVKRLANDNKDYVVSNGATLESVYNSNGRYSTSILPIDDVFKVHLKIQGVQPEDGGELGIRIPTIKQTFYGNMIKVLVPVQEVKLLDASGKDVSGGRLEVVEGTNLNLRCQALAASFNTPNATMWLTSGLDRKNVTGNFTLKKSDFGSSNMEGLAHPDATIMWEGRSFLVDQSLHDKKLVCESYMSDKAFPSKSVDLTFYVTSRPVIECPDTFLAMPGESNVTIACIVKSRPLPNLNEVVWSIVNETAPRRMSPGERRDEYSVSMKAVDNDMGKIVTSLLIDKVNDTIHYQTYSLRISNKVGFTEKAIQLKWGYSNSAGVMEFSKFLALLTLSIAVLRFV